MLQNLTGWHFLIILFVILLLFGAPKLPTLAKSLGQSMKILKKEVNDMSEDSTSKNTASQDAAPQDAPSQETVSQEAESTKKPTA